MKIKFITIVVLGLLMGSCKNKEKERETSVKLKEFGIEKDDAFMLHSNYPNESVKWDKLIASFGINNNVANESSFLINFKTENFLNKHTVDSVFVVLTPYPDENYGENSLIVNNIDGVFKNNFNWNNKPTLNVNNFALFRKIQAEEEKKIKIDITNLAKYSSSQYKFNLPLCFSLRNENLNEQTFASFYSINVDVEEVQPKLEVYYSK